MSEQTKIEKPDVPDPVQQGEPTRTEFDTPAQIAVNPPAAAAPAPEAPPVTGAMPRHDEGAVVITPAAASRPLAAPAVTPAPRPQAPRGPIHVAHNVLDMLTAPEEVVPQAAQAQEQRDLNAVVHSMLIAGVLVSSALMVAGVALELVRGQELPAAVPDLNDVLPRVLALRPSGFLALGLLVLIATPILRVVGSVLTFAYERDWRYAAITLLVLCIVTLSLFLGKG